ncbi:hypothetical protein HUN39_17325 [Methylocystis sp. FS]|uniref:hypothetical protein n=1 Tax=Methylocystis silviterrae TaxID=2743612 RepID=UPI0015819C9B|nr:hypothetical protein [Methylocystis silviterrae]NUJ81753.1 hypothetical protein [Methylocystis silviterrae]
MEAAQNSANHERPSPTVPSFQIKFLDVEAEAAQRFGVVIGEYIQEISRYIDLERLDGVTIANDYPAALRQLDRGFTASHELTPTASELVTGVAMTPSVRRDGVVKAHMVLMAGVIFPLEDEQHEFWKDALYVLGSRLITNS